MNIAPGAFLDARVVSQDNGLKELLKHHGDMIAVLAKLKNISYIDQKERPRKAASAVVEGATIYLLLEGVIDFQKEKERLEKELGKNTTELTSVSKKLSNMDFLKKAAPEVVEKARAKRDSLLEKESKLTLNLNRIKEMEQ
jgi:valyl-tRNA synthetase